jgi:hypothetical protein
MLTAGPGLAGAGRVFCGCCASGLGVGSLARGPRSGLRERGADKRASLVSGKALMRASGSAGCVAGGWDRWIRADDARRGRASCCASGGAGLAEALGWSGLGRAWRSGALAG